MEGLWGGGGGGGGGAINRTSDFILRLDLLGSRLVETKNVKQHILQSGP